MLPEGSMRAGILPGCPSPDRGSREADVGFEPQGPPVCNSQSNHFGHLAISICKKKQIICHPVFASREGSSTRGTELTALPGCKQQPNGVMFIASTAGSLMPQLNWWTRRDTSSTTGLLSAELVETTAAMENALTNQEHRVKMIQTRWSKWLERKLTDRKVRGSNPISASRLPLSRPGQPRSIPALMFPSGGMAVCLFIATPLSFERSCCCSGVIIPVSPHQREALDSSFALIRAHQQYISNGHAGI
ncbi:hypothetical protein T265_04977 [Opisthorchis viverrini]|uniref:Uncharacterized protein n=1 Tax=Opisthorchis viverrini TaxID=6198 RepID=A0A074ZM82_OPIVI|nr:hypothetical protein T265_04977 [Opisthorchis viverrini]KER28146.1 hypothetical protein T265_04977 [Opisthorchis viverrini]